MGLSLNGVRFALPITEVIERLVGLRPQVQALQTQLLARFLAREAVGPIDAYVVLGGDRPRPTEPLWAAREALRDRRKTQRTEQRRDPAVDTDSDVVLFPRGDHTLAMIIGDLDGIDTLLENIGACGWCWGRYERPTDVCEEEWAVREADWTAAMGGDACWIPSRRGVTYSYSDGLLPDPTPELVLASLPSHQERADDLAKQRIASEIYAQAEPGEHAFQLAMQAMWDRPRIRATAAPFIERLPTITLDALRSGPHPTV